ncbi:AAA family ATPase [Tropicimonas sp. IMCC6043]|uniref:ATP-binding protein n=1 Tax=Tropicimonas sp. IMCC6043 TaxID=2510645 RepID=UPI00101DE33B|nr:adenylate/guanylate cyclase domain-containing protein [Tropicimonas sp. IMCC6043]RYH12244.1 adenylate/guanylate cyclase domain-containing protein [Tropicimonas sp. IMCC6043]
MNAAVCPSCSAALQHGARFCSSCGARVTERSAARARFMTVLFCDLAESTSLTGTIGDEAMFDVVNRFREICNAAVIEHGGFVAKYMGDGMLAYFGYPSTLKNSAVPAVHAALEIVRRAGAIPLPGAGVLSASAGVATGWMVVAESDPGAPAGEALAIGGTVNLAARLQAEAGDGEVAVSAETGQRLEGTGVALTPRGARKLRGFAEPVEIWMATPDAATAPVARFVGRARSREQLRELWRSVTDGRVAVVEVTAPGGYGKTALVEAFLRESVDENDILRIACEPHLRDRSFACFRAFVDALAGLGSVETPDERRALLAQWAPEGAVQGLALLYGLDAAQPAPIVRNELVSQALLALLETTISEAPVVLFVEDAHWIDTESAALLSGLPERLAGRPLFILVTRRPEGPETVAEGVVPIRLDRIETESAASLVADLDANGVIPPETRRRIVELAGGVPLYLEHITKAVLERPDRDATQTIPPTMIEALLERFDHVGDLRDLVDAAAVLGAEVRIDVLAAMVGRDEAEISGQLADLIRRGLFVPGGGGTVSFDHALIRDAVMQTLLRARKLQLHDTALAAYRAVAPGRLEAQPVTAATHLMGAGRPAEAIPFLVRAAQLAVTQGEVAEAIRLMDWAEEGLLGITEGPVRDELEMAVKFSRGLALVQQRGFSDASVAEAYRRAMELCLARGRSGESEFQIAWGIWAHYLVRGDVPRGTEMNRRMDEIAAELPELEVLAACAAAPMLCNQGRLAEQEATTHRVRRLYQPHLHRHQAVHYSQDSLEIALLFQIHGRYLAGDLAGWQATLREALDHEAFLELPFLEPYIRIYSHAPYSYALTDFDYRPVLEGAVARAVELGQPFWIAAGAVWLAHERMRNESPTAALADFEAAIAQMDAIGLRLGGAYHRACLARCRADAGDFGSAQQAMGRAMQALEQGGDLLYAPEVHRLRAEIALLQDPAATALAEADLAQADTLAVEAGTRAWSALIAASRARLMAGRAGQVEAEAWLAAELARLTPEGAEAHPAFVTAARAFTDPI